MIRGKKTGVFLVCIVILALVGCGDRRKASGENSAGSSDSGQEVQTVYQEVLEGDSAPDFTVETADGGTFVLSEYSGKVVLLNFWATWCGPCVREMPAFEKLHSDYGEDVVILAVNCMEDKDTVSQFISDNGYTFPIAYDLEGTASMKYPSDGIPYTLVIDKEGIVRNVYLGARDADEQYEEYKSAIEAALE
ncbi:MAG: TlpA family protein disulfide reductase [Lachnospiraceae bacterium]|nr:TlpA family protein disulfide reductase [Lachnospiraceae bacterium]MDE6624737.1 TlpA family protein disulfide reductase [Lachnospiraceae bacterium]